MKRVLLICALLTIAAPAASFNYWDEPDSAPYLENIGTPPACDYTISSAAGWAQINNAAYRVFCVASGDYISAGSITITADGTPSAKKWLRYAGTAGSDVHPYAMTTEQRAIVLRLIFSGADHWIVDRLSIDGTTASDSTSGVYVNNADYVVINKTDVTGHKGSLVTFKAGSDYGVIQGSTLHDQRTSDAVGVGLHSWNNGSPVALTPTTFTRIVDNEIWNVADGIQALGENDAAANEDYQGTVIYNNDIYSTPSRYKDCSGAYDTDGPCSIDENAIDLKNASESSSYPMIIAHNRMWGWRATDPVSSGDSSSWGNAIDVHYGIKNLQLSGNIVWDSPRLLGLSEALNTVSIESNLWHSPYPYSKPGQTGFRGLLNGSTSQTALVVANNVFSQMPETISGSIGVKWQTGVGATYSDNALVDVLDSDLITTPWGGTISGNAYYSASDSKPAWDTGGTYVGASIASVYDNQFCTTIKRITNPTQQCFDMALHDDNVVSGVVPAPGSFKIND